MKRDFLPYTDIIFYELFMFCSYQYTGNTFNSERSKLSMTKDVVKSEKSVNST